MQEYFNWLTKWYDEHGGNMSGAVDGLSYVFHLTHDYAESMVQIWLEIRCGKDILQ